MAALDTSIRFSLERSEQTTFQLKFALCSPSICTCNNAFYSQSKVGFCPGLAATKRAVPIDS
jgi:hypothetical protein